MRQLDLALGQAGWGRGRPARRLHPLPHRPLRRWPAPIVEAAGCELWMHPAWEHVRPMAERSRRRRSSNRIEVARQSGVPAAALERYREPRAATETGIDAIVEPDRELLPRGRGRDRPRHLAGLRDAGPRALARRPPPARARAADLRRPPARPHSSSSTTATRPDPVGEFLAQPRRGRASSTSASSCPATAGPSATPARRSPAYRKQVDELLGTGPRRRSRDGREDAFEVVERDDRRGEHQRARRRLGAAALLSCLDHLAILGEAERVAGTDPVVWRLDR